MKAISFHLEGLLISGSCLSLLKSPIKKRYFWSQGTLFKAFSISIWLNGILSSLPFDILRLVFPVFGEL